MKKALTLAAAIGSLSVASVALAPVTSGLNPGERVSPFHPSHITGPLADTSNCFPCTFQNRPQVQIWINGDSHTNIAAFAKTLEAAMDSKKSAEFKALLVFVAPKAQHDAIAAQIKQGATMMHTPSIGMAVIDPSNEAVSNYKINTDSGVKNTVFVYKNWKVEQKFVNLKADKKGLEQLNAAIDTITK